MARKLSGREVALIAVLAAAATAVLFFREDSRLFGGGGDAEREAAPLGDAPLVRIDRLMAQGDGFDTGGRNLFEYYVPPPPPRPVRPPQPVKKQDPKPVNTRPVTQRVVPPTQTRAQPPKVSFRYLGFLGPKDEKIGVFEKGQELELAAIGEVIEREFRLMDFKYESVVLGYVDERFQGQTTELKMSR